MQSNYKDENQLRNDPGLSSNPITSSPMIKISNFLEMKNISIQ
jgi:hypothetical protein